MADGPKQLCGPKVAATHRTSDLSPTPLRRARIEHERCEHTTGHRSRQAAATESGTAAIWHWWRNPKQLCVEGCSSVEGDERRHGRHKKRHKRSLRAAQQPQMKLFLTLPQEACTTRSCSRSRNAHEGAAAARIAHRLHHS